MKVRSVGAVVTLLAAAFLLGGCDDRAAVATTQPPPPEVSFVTITPSPKPIVRELPGRIAPTRVADVRARVSGIVIARLFEQGSEVKAGDALYQIDPKPFEVELLSAEAALAKAEAVLEQSSLQSQRIAALISKQAASLAENEAAVATERQAAADVAARKADVAKARLNLEYATVRAPIRGVVGAALVTEGALVVQNDTTSLATIQQLDSVYADFTQSSAELNRLRRELESGALERIAPDAAKVNLVLDDGKRYPIDGKLLFSDMRVDSQTGKVTLRGEFSNPSRELLPGMYVRVQIEQGIDKDAVLVPQQAIQRTAAGNSEVFVLSDDNRAIVRPVRVGTAINGQWLVIDGLRQGDRVIVEGFQKFTAGDIVRPNPWPQEVAAAPAKDAAPQKQLR